MRIAIVGATGAVGQEMRSILALRGFDAARLTLLASSRSAGKQVNFNGSQISVEQLTADSFAGVDLALFSAGAQTSKAFAQAVRAAGAIMIDNSSAFRMDPQVPLVIPEINPQDARTHQGLIAVPNCSTIIVAMAVWPVHRVNPIRRLVVSTYQAASGAGAAAMAELEEQTRTVLDGKPAQPNVLPYQLAFNLFSHDSPIDETGYNQEERKMVYETRKIFHDSDIQISATCIRAPILRSHSASINLTCERPITEREVLDLLSEAPGVTVVDDRKKNYFPMPIDASGKDDVLVGRIRQDSSDPTGRSMVMFACGDQLRKGAALNAVQIADLIAQ